MLQWGRGLLAAEGEYDYDGHRIETPLQWGRGLLAAEGLRLHGEGLRFCHGFNGAAACWPRKEEYREKQYTRGSTLQWGRGLLAAEGQVSAQAHGWFFELQWGRGLLAAEGW